jgi:alkylhydroperoxidase family enzyme
MLGTLGSAAGVRRANGELSDHFGDPALDRGALSNLHARGSTASAAGASLPAMAWIRTIALAEAEGLLRRLYDAAERRAGKVFEVLRIQSLRPHALDASTRLYAEVMLSPRSALSRAERELVATVVARTVGCRY